MYVHVLVDLCVTVYRYAHFHFFICVTVFNWMHLGIYGFFIVCTCIQVYGHIIFNNLQLCALMCVGIFYGHIWTIYGQILHLITGIFSLANLAFYLSI